MAQSDDEPVKIDLDPEVALRALLKVDPDSEPATQTIYVELLDEAVPVWRPVEAFIEAEGVYRLPDKAPEGERWAFAPGSHVRCEPRSFPDGGRLVACAALAHKTLRGKLL